MARGAVGPRPRPGPRLPLVRLRRAPRRGLPRGRRMKIALVHDWLTGLRGGERVLEQLCLLYPDADIFTLVHIRGSAGPIIHRPPLTTSLSGLLPQRPY